MAVVGVGSGGTAVKKEPMRGLAVEDLPKLLPRVLPPRIDPQVYKHVGQVDEPKARGKGPEQEVVVLGEQEPLAVSQAELGTEHQARVNHGVATHL